MEAIWGQKLAYSYGAKLSASEIAVTEAETAEAKTAAPAKSAVVLGDDDYKLYEDFFKACSPACEEVGWNCETYRLYHFLRQFRQLTDFAIIYYHKRQKGEPYGLYIVLKFFSYIIP